MKYGRNRIQQAYELVERLTIDDLRVFCSTFGLNDYGTKEQLKKRLIQYYQTKFAETKEYLLMRQEDNTEERINKVEESVRELKFSIQSELAVFRQSMEAIMTTLQAPTSSTPLPHKVNFVEESASTKEEFASCNGNLTQQDTILLSKMNRKKIFLAISVERIMTELQRLIEEKADVKLVERKLTKLNEAESTRTSGRLHKGKTGKIEERLVSASALLNRTESKPICGFCSKPHDTETSKIALEKSPEERWSMLKSNSIIQTCYNCLKPGSVSHNSRTCKRPKCSIDACGKRHHNLLHTCNQADANKKTEDVETIAGFVSLKTGQQNLLPTALARLIHEGKELVVRVLFDSGSEETFVRSSVIDSLGLKKRNVTTSMKINMLGGENQQKKVHRVSFQLAPLHTTGETESTHIEAWTVKNVCVPLDAVKFDLKQCNHLRSLKFAEKFPRSQATVDVLIGIDQYHELLAILRNGVHRVRLLRQVPSLVG